MSLKKAIERFLTYVEITKSKGTLRYDREKLRVIEKHLGHKQCKDIDKDDILGFILNRKKNNVSNRTINKYVTTLNRCLKYNGYEPIFFEKLREQNKVIPTVDQATIDKIFSYYETRLHNKHNHRNYLFFSLLLDTGLRINELLNITVENIDYDKRTIFIEVTKTKSDRFVFYKETTQLLLESFIDKFDITDYLFFDFKNGNQLTYEAVNFFIKRLSKRLNIEKSISPHKWRHTFATNFVRNGGSIEALRMILGHTDLRTTQKYLHLDKNDLKNEYDKIMRTNGLPTV